MAWLRLDRFEGEMYEHRQVQVQQEDGQVKLSQIHIIRPGFAHRLSPGEWGFARFIAHYLGFQDIED